MARTARPPAATRPFAAFEWMVAGRYLRARRAEGFVSVIAGFSLLGIALGVATLIIVMAVMNGFRHELLGRILGLNGHLLVQSYAGPLYDYDARAARIQALPGILRAVPMVEGQVLASGARGATGALVRGQRYEDLRAQSIVADNITAGALAGLRRPDGAVIGERLAQSLGLRVGDRITLISPRGPATPFGVAPRSKSYEIVATFLIGMAEYDSSFVFVPLAEAQRFFGLGEGVSAIEVVTAAPEEIERFRRPVLEAAGPGVMVTDWRQLNESFFNALGVERNVMFLILTLIILVAAFNIISGLVMLVKDKGSDIAILRTMGASGGAVLRIFFIAGASIGLVGTLTGLALGTVFCLNIENLRQFVSRLTGTELFSPEVYFLSQLPADMDPHEVGMVVAMALGLSFLATLYPAWRAARLDPVEALRHG